MKSTPKPGTWSEEVSCFRLDEPGLGRFFGQRQAQIMAVMWLLGEATVQDVCDQLGDVNYKTILTVMNRLTQKGILSCYPRGRAYRYYPTVDRETFLAQILHKLAHGLLEDFGEAALEQIVETAHEIDPALLDRLAHMIRQKRRSESQNGGTIRESH